MITLLVALATGCATPAGPRPTASVIMANVPCLPPGITAEFLSWPVAAFHALSAPSEAGGDVAVHWVLCRRGKSQMAVLWSATDLLAADPSPETEEPEWVDSSLLGGDGQTLRANPEAPCQWRRPKTST